MDKTLTQTRMPTVLQVIPALDAGGAERGCVDVALALARAGGTAIVASEGGRLAGELERGGARHVTLPLASKNPRTMWANAARLADLIAETGADVIHARSRAPAWSALRAARRTGAHFVTTYHGVYNARGPLKRLYNSVMARGERVVAISDFVAAHVRAAYPYATDRIVTIPRGIDIDRFSPASVTEVRKVRLLEQWGLLDDPRKILFLPGRLTRWKGQAVMIEAAALLRARRDDFVCVIAGDAQGRDAYEGELGRMVREHALEHFVKLPGHLVDISAGYALCDIAVSASIEPEAFGRVPVEAQAMERPVIATAHGGAAETVIDGVTGFLVPPGDAKALAAGLDACLDLGPRYRAEMGAKGRAHVQDTYTVERMCASYIEVYRSLCD